MNRWRVGEDRGGKETDGCPLTLPPLQSAASRRAKTARRLPGPCKGNLTDLRRIFHLSLAKGNPKYIYKSSRNNTQHLPSQGKSKENALRTLG
jgi:hypothetical protein